MKSIDMMENAKRRQLGANQQSLRQVHSAGQVGARFRHTPIGHYTRLALLAILAGPLGAIGQAIFSQTAAHAQAGCPVIAVGRTAGGQNLNRNNHECVVKRGAKIRTTRDGEPGVSGGRKQKVVNHGTIETSGQMKNGVRAHAIIIREQSEVLNTGVLRTLGDRAAGVTVRGSAAKVRNRGLVSTRGEYAEGIDARGNKNEIINMGTIATTGDNGEGIEIEGHWNKVVNLGYIRTTGDHSEALLLFIGDNNHIINRGRLFTSGLNAEGALIMSKASAFENSGDIITLGDESHGIDFQRGGTHTLINSGLVMVRGKRANAIDMDDGADLLVLRPGSVLSGLIRLGKDKDTVHVHTKLTNFLTFTNDGGLPEIIDTKGRPYLRVVPRNGENPMLVVFEPGDFSHDGARLDDLTSSIFNSVHARLDAEQLQRQGRGDEPVLAAQMGAAMGLYGGDLELQPRRSGFWGQLFGAYHEENENNSDLGRTVKHGLTGGLVGFDMPIKQESETGLRLGVYVGAARGKTRISTLSQAIETKNLFGGVYGEYSENAWFARLMLTAGRVDHDSSRQVLNNLSPTGFSNLTAAYDGTFLSPELTLGGHFSVGERSLTPSVRVRYGHLALDGYTETGAVAGMSMGKRNVDVWSARAQVATTQRIGSVVLSPRFGIEGRANKYGDIALGLLGQTLNFAPRGRNETFTGLAGVSVVSKLADGLSTHMDAEMHFGHGVFSLNGHFGAVVSF